MHILFLDISNRTMQTSHEIVNVVEHEQKTESRYKARPVVALS